MSFLDQILESKRQEVASLQSQPNPFSNLFNQDKPILIAEIKPKSPSAGSLYKGDLIKLAQTYQTAGVDALSVLTDEPYFGGSPQLLQDIKAQTSLPILRKDFIIDESQLYQTLAIGADAVLLIVSILDDSQLHNLIKISHKIGLVPLVEVYNDQELERAIAAEATHIGVNARDLHTFKVDLEMQQKVLKNIPNGIIRVSLSGINTPEDIKKVHATSSPNGYLIGTSILKSTNIAKTIREYQKTMAQLSPSIATQSEHTLLSKSAKEHSAT